MPVFAPLTCVCVCVACSALLMAVAIPAWADAGAGTHVHWSRTCSGVQTVQSKGKGYFWQTHTRYGSSWWSGNYSGAQWRTKTWWGFSYGAGEIYSEKVVASSTGCRNIS